MSAAHWLCASCCREILGPGPIDDKGEPCGGDRHCAKCGVTKERHDSMHFVVVRDEAWLVRLGNTPKQAHLYVQGWTESCLYDDAWNPPKHIPYEKIRDPDNTRQMVWSTEAAYAIAIAHPKPA